MSETVFKEWGHTEDAMWKAAHKDSWPFHSFVEGGSSFPIARKQVYLSGPMRGYPRYNFDAFIAATYSLRSHKALVASPHEHDLECGIDPDVPEKWNGDTSELMRWDANAVIDCDLVVVLPGWERSTGCAAELTLAKAVGKPIRSFVTWELIEIPTLDGILGWGMIGEPIDDVLTPSGERVRWSDGGPARITEPDSNGVRYFETGATRSSDDNKHDPLLKNLGLIMPDADSVRMFSTGATRSSDNNKHDPEGFIDPAVLIRYCEYMTHHRYLPDGSVRASDNWQSGIPKTAYAKSLVRHLLDFWQLHRAQSVVRPEDGSEPTMQDTLCALIFNASGYLHELLKEDRNETA